MAKISINSEQIKAQVKKIEETTAQLYKEAERVNKANQDCKIAWSSQAGNVFYTKVENNRVDFLKTVLKIERLSNNIMEITKRIEWEDREKAKEIRAL